LEYKLCNDIPYSLTAANHQPRLVGESFVNLGEPNIPEA
ncbi:hypothetical protein ZEAMMB73_Zm00001d024101, partial [Zea mays]